MIVAQIIDGKKEICMTTLQGYLIHRWEDDNNILHSQCVAQAIVSSAIIFKHNNIHHLFYVNRLTHLVHHSRYYDAEEEEWIIKLQILIEQVRPQINPILFQQGKQLHLCCGSKEGNILEVILTLQAMVVKFNTISIDSKWQMRQIKLLSIGPKLSAIYLIGQESIHFTYVQQESYTLNQWTTLKFDSIAKNSKISIIVQQGDIYFYFNDKDGNLFQCKQNDQRKIIILEKIIFTNIQFNNFALINNNNAIECYLSCKNSIYKSQFNGIRWSQPCLIINDVQCCSNLQLLISDGCLNLFYLNANEMLVQYYEDSNKFIEKKQKEMIFWQDIQAECQPLGDSGWHADAFFHHKTQLVVKKARKPISYLINRQISNLEYLSQIKPMLRHQLIKNKSICGLTLEFIKGAKWDNIISTQNNLFQASSIARVSFVIKLSQQMRQLQRISFCHGDLHLSNILIDIIDPNIQNPVFNVKIIDFGNGFHYKQGQLVSYGLTGMQIIIPFEVESIGKKNYCPVGINAYQLGRNCLQILLLRKHCETQHLQYLATKQLEQLKSHTQYPEQICAIMSDLVNIDPLVRNKALEQDFSFLLDKTRQRFYSKIQL